MEDKSFASSAIDGDVVQAVTAATSELVDSSELRKMTRSKMRTVSHPRAAFFVAKSIPIPKEVNLLSRGACHA